MSFSLDKWSGKKIYMIAARKLSIVWADTPHYWKWISLPESRFEDVAELMRVCWLEVRGKIDIRMLAPSTLYKAYLVFKLTAGAFGFEHQPVKVSVGMLGEGHPSNLGWRHINDAEYPMGRDDGWLEIELGEFLCQGGEDGELEMTCLEVRGGHWKTGITLLFSI